MTTAVQPIDTGPAQGSARLKPYPAYQESRLPWVPVVPTHWGLQPNRAMLSRRKVLVGARHTQYRLLSLTKEGVIVRDVSSGKGKFSSDMGTSQEVRRGDLIFCFFDVPETPRTVGLSHHDGMITSAYTVLECQDPALASFLELFYRAMDDRKLLSPLYSGLRNTIPPSRFLGTKSPVPLPDEQNKIVAFLDHLDRLTRIYVKAKQKLIALLNVQKHSIIQRAVTRGLNPTATMKSSGVAWLGDVPAHWGVSQLRRSLAPRSTRGRPDLPLLSVVREKGIIPRAGQTKEDNHNVIPEDLSNYKVVSIGDLVVNKMKAWQGSMGVSPYDGIVSPAYFVYRVTIPVNPRYLHFLLRNKAFVGFYNSISKGVRIGQWDLDIQGFKDTPLLIPPPEEQAAIVAHVESLVSRIEGSVKTVDNQIALVREYGTRLISDVVTGKVDVRNVPVESVEAETAATEEASEAEPAEEAVNADASDAED